MYTPAVENISYREFKISPTQPLNLAVVYFGLTLIALVQGVALDCTYQYAIEITTIICSPRYFTA